MKLMKLTCALAACALAAIMYAQDAKDTSKPTAKVPVNFTCPVMGDAIETPADAGGHFDIKGIRYYVCCEICTGKFPKNPDKYIKANNGKKVIGQSLFDPISTKHIAAENAAAYSEYKGIRYYFSSEDNKLAFDKKPVQYVAPAKEMLYCPVNKEKVASYEKASDYSDYKGVRYYFCCAGCKEPFDKDPEKYLKDLPSSNGAESGAAKEGDKSGADKGAESQESK